MRRQEMDRREPDRGEILDALEMVYAWHSMPGREFFKRYGDMVIYSKMWGLCDPPWRVPEGSLNGGQSASPSPDG
jgi:hypothetical protein